MEKQPAVSANTSGKRILFAGILWAVTYICCLLVLKEFSPGKTTGIALSLLPVVAFAYFIFRLSKGISQMDELEIRIHLEATAFAFSFSLMLLMLLGLLDMCISLNKEDWGYRHLVPYFFIFYLLGMFLSRKKYLWT